MDSFTNQWQIKLNSNKERDGHLLDTGLWSDVTFVVGTGPQQTSIKAHKLILARVSPIFASLYYGKGIDHLPVSTAIPDQDPKVFKAMLVFIYTNDIKIDSLEFGCQLYRIAKKCALPQLTQECLKQIISKIEIKNSVMTYDFARVFNIPDLMDKAMKIIRIDTKEALSQENIFNVGIKTMVDIFNDDELNIDSEIELFKIAEVYSWMNATQPKTNHLEIKEQEVSIHDVIKKIRFLTLSPEEFIEGPAKSNILSLAESLAIIDQIFLSTEYKLTNGLSPSTTKRNNGYLYCTRTFDIETDWHNNWAHGNRYCLILLKLNASTQLMGIQIPTQIQMGNIKEKYEENINIQIWYLSDEEGSSKDFTFKKIVSYNSLHTVYFDTPCCIEAHKKYAIHLKFQTKGHYPMAVTNDEVEERAGPLILNFQFDSEFSNIRSGIIRKLIFKNNSGSPNNNSNDNNVFSYV